MARTSDMVRPALLFISALLLGITGCSGNGAAAGGGGGITGTGVTTGQITGFGSVIVNGIKFTRKTGLADDRVKLGFENNTSAQENNLRVGMIVNVKGAVDSSAGTGEYESIEFQPEIRGPLDDAAANGVDLINNRVKVMGREIQVEANTTFDSIRDIAEIKGELDAGRHPELEVSGNLDGTGMLHATRIARKSSDFTAGPVEIKGKIATATGGSFTIGSVTVIFTTAALSSNIDVSEIATGTLVAVKGTLSAGVIAATRIEKKKAVDAEVNDNVRIKGIAVGGVANNTFTLNGPNGAITVTTTAASFLKGGAPATSAIAATGATLEVEGSLQADGSIAATRISIEVEKNVKLEGDLAAAADIDEAARTIRLNGVTVAVVDVTKLLDGSTLIAHLTAFKTALSTGSQHLQITGVLDATGKVGASQVQRYAEPAKPISFIQGPVDSADNTAQTLTIMGITVNTASVILAKDFVDNRLGMKTPFDIIPAVSRTKFFEAITSEGLGFAVVKANGTFTGAAMTAEELELEQPL